MIPHGSAVPRPGFRPCKGAAERSAGDLATATTGCESQESHVIHSHGYNMVTTWLQLTYPGCLMLFAKYMG